VYPEQHFENNQPQCISNTIQIVIEETVCSGNAVATLREHLPDSWSTFPGGKYADSPQLNTHTNNSISRVSVKPYVICLVSHKCDFCRAPPLFACVADGL
jgi:hypothetical protein